MFKYLQRTVDENGKNVGYLLVNLETDEEVSFSNKELKSMLINNEIKVEGLIISDSGRVIEYDEEKERLKLEKKQELTSLLSMEVRGDAWQKETVDTFTLKAKSGLFDILSALDGSYTVYRCNEYEDNSVILDKDSGLVALGQDDKSLNLITVEETSDTDVDVYTINHIIDKYYGLSLPITADKKVLLTTSKSLFMELSETYLDDLNWDFVDGLKKECKNNKLFLHDFTYNYGYEGNNFNLIYRTLPTFLRFSDRELVDVTLSDFKLYRVAWTKGLRENMIRERLNENYVNSHVDALLNKSYVLVENEEDFYSFVDSLALPRDWFILRDAKTYKENDLLYKQIGVGVFFTEGLYQITDGKYYIETILY